MIAPGADVGIETKIAGFLVFHENVDFCDDCLAAVLGFTPDRVRTAATKLARSPAILRDRWACSRCGRNGLVTRALANRTFAMKHGSRSRLMRSA